VIELVENWEMKKESLSTVDLSGKEIVLQNVPVRYNKDRNISMVRIEDVAKAEQEYLSKKQRLNPKQVPILALLFAKLPFDIKGAVKVSKGQIKEATRFNKMLFELWQRTIEAGYDELYPKHSFYGDVYGPVSKDLKPMVKDLEDKGLVKAELAKRNGETSVYTLTEKGFDEAQKVWRNTPKELKEIITQTKNFLALAPSKEIIDYFHKKYPEYRKIKEPRDCPN